MIHKFNQFINENNHQMKLSVHKQINEPFANFIEQLQERVNMFKMRVAELLNEMDRVIERVSEEFEDLIVGEPEIKVDSDLSNIEVLLHTNIPNNEESWETDESPAQDLEYKLNRYFGNLKNVRTEVNYKPDTDGNCAIELSMYVVDLDHFAEEYIDAYKALVEEY